jgi:cytochrome c oxidase subunit 4
MSEHEHHVLPFKLYLQIFLTLVCLTFITVWVAQYNFGGTINTIIAMAVATVKATLVALYFMHLKYDDKTNAVCLLAGVFFLVVMFAFIAIDVGSRIPLESTL